MAQLSDKSSLNGLRGSVGRQLVFKQYGNKTVVTKFPDMSHIKPSVLQVEKRKLFAGAAEYASAICRNPEQKAAYQKKVQKGQSVYHYALKEYLALHKK